MKGRQIRDLLATACREVQIVDVKMDDVELVLALEDLFNLVDMAGDRIPAIRIKAQSLIACRNEECVGEGIGAGEQRDVVALTHEFLGQPGDNSFRTSVKTGRNTLVKRRYLCNPHSHLGKSLKLARKKDPPSLNIASDTDLLLPALLPNSLSGSFETAGKSLKTGYLARSVAAIRCSLQGETRCVAEDVRMNDGAVG